MPPMYRRVLSQSLAQLVRPGGPLASLLSLHRDLIDGDPFALDVQLRERNSLAYYHGGCVLLTVAFHKAQQTTDADDGDDSDVGAGAGDGGGNGTGELTFDAPAVLLEHTPEVGSALAELAGSWRVENVASRLDLVRDYLIAAVAAAEPSYYAGRGAGFWANRLAVFFGPMWTPDKDWLVIDRDVVLSHSSTEQDAGFHETVSKPYVQFRTGLCRRDPETWGTEMIGQGFGGGIDLLAIGPGNELVTIGIRHGGEPAGLHWGPLQLAVQRDAWIKALPSVNKYVHAAVGQRIQLGLLPPAASRRWPRGGYRKVRAMLAVADWSEDAPFMERLQIVRSLTPGPRIEMIGVISGQPITPL